MGLDVRVGRKTVIEEVWSLKEVAGLYAILSRLTSDTIPAIFVFIVIFITITNFLILFAEIYSS